MSLWVRTLTAQQAGELLWCVQQLVAQGELTLGEALRVLRAGYLRKSRGAYARLCRISEAALAQIESDLGNPTLETLNQVFGPFGMRLGLVSRLPHRWQPDGSEQGGVTLERWRAPIAAALARSRRTRTSAQ